MKDGKITKEEVFLIIYAFAIKDHCKGLYCTDCVFHYGHGGCRLGEVPQFWDLEYQGGLNGKGTFN